VADNVAVTAGTGTTVAADEVVDGTLGTVKVQYVKLMDGTLDGTTKAAVGARGVAVDIAAAAAAIAKAEDVASADADVGVPAMAVRKATPANTSGTDGDYEMLQMSAGRLWTSSDLTLAGTAVTAGSGAIAAGTPRVALATDSPGVLANRTTMGTLSNGFVQVGIPTDMDWPSGTTGFMKKEDVASADGDAGIAMLAVRKATPANTSGTDGDYEFPQISGGYLWVHDNKGLSNLVFSAAFSTLTRPANTTAYAAGDSISDNATAGSVTALSATISDVNDDPIFISEILINSTDTGLAGKRIRAYLYNSDPTASTGVGGGDNAAFANKKAGYIGSFSGVLETGFSDGAVGRLVPAFNDTTTAPSQNAPAGGFIVTKPTSGAKTLFIQYQTLDAFTPSANSTTIIGTARGWQGRAV
jgi:hypothetical protein